MNDKEIKNLEDKKFLANRADRSLNTDKITKKLDELKPKDFPEQIKVQIEGAELLTIKGQQGDKGERGEQGVQGEQGIQGIEGKQGAKGLKGDKGDQGEKGEPGANSDVPGVQGEQGIPGKNGSPDTGLEVAKKLTELKGEDRLDIESLKGLDKVESNFLQQAKGFVSKTLAGQADVNIPNPTNNQILTYNKATNKWIATSAGSGSGTVQTIVAGTGISVNSSDPANPIVTNTVTGITGTASFNETPSGTIDGSNAIFTLAHTPNQTSFPLSLFLNGARQRAGGVDMTLSGSTITFITPPEAGSTLWADYFF